MTVSEQASLAPRPYDDFTSAEESSRLWSDLHQAVSDMMVELRKYPENLVAVRRLLEKAMGTLEAIDPSEE